MPLLLAACSDEGDKETGTQQLNLAHVRQVLETNADIALSAYEDAIETAEALKEALQAFEADPTLGGLVFDACVTEVRPPGDTELGAVTYYGIPFVIQVSAAGL